MDRAQIPKTKSTNLPPAGAAPVAVLTEAREEMLRVIEPDLIGRIALLDNEQRAEVFKVVDRLIAIGAAPEEPPAPAVLPVKRPAKKKKKNRGSYNESELAQLRAEAKSLGINVWQKSKVDLRAEIADRKGG